MKRIGVKDIALKAGVSTGTVDRVLHNRGEVKAETRQRILAIVDELDYKPNIFARSLASKTPKRIAILTPDARDKNPFWNKSVEGFERAKEELADHHIKLWHIHYDASQEESYVKAFEQILETPPDGVILNPVFKSTTQRHINLLEEMDIPYVFIDVNLENANNLSYFGQNAHESGNVAGKLMYSTLEKDSKILIIKLSKNKFFSQHIDKRIIGFMSFFKTSTAPSISIIEMSYEDLAQEQNVLDEMLVQGEYKHLFVPNSRAYLIAQHLRAKGSIYKTLIGYDLIDENIEEIRNNTISFLIGQRPQEQAYKATLSLFNHLVSKEEQIKVNYSPIDILIKENIEFYINTNH